MQLIDTHCHIDLYPDYSALIDECERLKITTVAVTNAPSVFRQCRKLLEGKRYLRAAIGLHPELAHLRSDELPLFSELLAETRFVGEVGLDFVTTDEHIRTTQRRIFQTILSECSCFGDRVVSVHSRRAAAEVVEMVGSGFASKVILHWYSGSLKAANQAIANGCYFSVNTAMATSDAGRRLIAEIPRERLLTESDGPFVRVKDRPARPDDVLSTIEHVAQIWKSSTTDVAATIRQNFMMMLQ